MESTVCNLLCVLFDCGIVIYDGSCYIGDLGQLILDSNKEMERICGCVHLRASNGYLRTVDTALKQKGAAAHHSGGKCNSIPKNQTYMLVPTYSVGKNTPPVTVNHLAKVVHGEFCKDFLANKVDLF